VHRPIAVDGVRVMTSDQIEHLVELRAGLAIIAPASSGASTRPCSAHFKQTAVELFDSPAADPAVEDEDVSAGGASRFTEISVTQVHRSDDRALMAGTRSSSA